MSEPDYSGNMVKVTPESLQGPVAWLMTEEMVPGCNVNIMSAWIKERPKPNPMHDSFESHDYDEIIFTIGADPYHPEYLGAEIEGHAGDERQLTTKTTALYIPRGVEHGRVKWLSFARPHMQLAIKLSGKIEKPGEPRQPVARTDRKAVPVSEPLRELAAGVKFSGRTHPPLTYLSNSLAPGCNVYLEYVWIWEMPSPNPLAVSHSHNYDEIVLNIGSDPEHPEYLGGEIEAYLGGTRQVTDATSAVFIPKTVPHGPIKWTKFERPHIQMSIMLGTGDPCEAMPGGNRPA